MDQLTADLIAQVEQAAPQNAGFEETIAALAGALWRTVQEEASGHQLLTELALLALRTPVSARPARLITNRLTRSRCGS